MPADRQQEAVKRRARIGGGTAGSVGGPGVGNGFAALVRVADLCARGLSLPHSKDTARPGTPAQADQSPLVPRERYRLGLAALGKYCQAQFQKAFSALDGEQRDKVLTGLEKGEIALDGIDAKLFFGQVLGNTMEGFFADPIYGGNRDMVSWKMLGFPGARYDYREYVGLHNQKLDLTPISIVGSSVWNRKA